jgi:hypothetical protein
MSGNDGDTEVIHLVQQLEMVILLLLKRALHLIRLLNKISRYWSHGLVIISILSVLILFMFIVNILLYYPLVQSCKFCKYLLHCKLFVLALFIHISI